MDSVALSRLFLTYRAEITRRSKEYFYLYLLNSWISFSAALVCSVCFLRKLFEIKLKC